MLGISKVTSIEFDPKPDPALYYTDGYYLDDSDYSFDYFTIKGYDCYINYDYEPTDGWIVIDEPLDLLNPTEEELNYVELIHGELVLELYKRLLVVYNKELNNV